MYRNLSGCGASTKSRLEFTGPLDERLRNLTGCRYIARLILSDFALELFEH